MHWTIRRDLIAAASPNHYTPLWGSGPVYTFTAKDLSPILQLSIENMMAPQRLIPLLFQQPFTVHRLKTVLMCSFGKSLSDIGIPSDSFRMKHAPINRIYTGDTSVLMGPSKPASGQHAWSNRRAPALCFGKADPTALTPALAKAVCMYMCLSMFFNYTSY